ncbi:MAG: OmpA family protein, partial [Bacteroidota bacterium]
AKYAASKIMFKFASDELLPSSFNALNEIVKIMNDDSRLKLKIEAYADSIGREERKMMWSEMRAKSVANYFISKGIAADRITSKGYGDKRPIADNGTEEGRAKNRRVEMVIEY